MSASEEIKKKDKSKVGESIFKLGYNELYKTVEMWSLYNR